MNLFFEKMLNHTILSNAEMVELVIKYQHGDIASGHKVLRHNYRFIYKIVELYVPRSKEYFSDVFTEAVLGMQHSMSKFDAKTGVLFLSYSIWWIKNHINAYFLNQHYQMRITESQAKSFVADVNAGVIQDVESVFQTNDAGEIALATAKKGRPKKSDKKSLKFSYSSRYIRTAIHKTLFVQALDPKNPDSDGIDTLPSEDLMPVIDSRECLRTLVDKICVNLPDRYQRVLKLAYGIDGTEQDMPLSELSQHFGNISRERVRQVKKQAIRSAQYAARRAKITAMTVLENTE